MAHQFLSFEAEVAESEAMAIGADLMAVCTGERFQSLGGADRSNDAELCDGDIEFGIRSTGDHENGPAARDAGDDRDHRAVDLAYGRTIEPPGDVAGGADNEIKTVLGGIFEFDLRLGKPSRQCCSLNGAANPLHRLRLEQVLAVEHDADRDDAIAARSDRGDVGDIGGPQRTLREQQSGLRGIDPGPQFLGRVHGTIDPVPVVRSDADGISTLPQQAFRNVEFGDPQAVSSPHGQSLDGDPVQTVPLSGNTDTEDSVPTRKRAFPSACLLVT